MLRPYQREGSDAIKRLFAAGAKSVLYQSPTGSGKGFLISHIFRGLHDAGLPAWLLVHRWELVRQLSDALEQAGVPHGIIAHGHPFQPLRPIQIGSIGSMGARAGSLRAPWLVAEDEAHHSVCATWSRVREIAGNTRFLGLTATPQRLDGRGLAERYEHLLVGPSVAELIAVGHLSPYRMWAPPGIDIRGVRIQRGDFSAGDLARAADRPKITGDAIAHYQRLCPGKRFICFAASIAHSEHVAEAFNGAGIPTEHVDGNTPMPQRKSAMERFRRGEILGLVNVSLFGEGIDVPGVEAVIRLRATMSLTVYLQQIGRALRPAPGKHTAYIIDHTGDLSRHGYPDEDRVWTLAGRPKKPSDDGTKRIRGRVCPHCFAAIPGAPTTCRFCGFIFGRDFDLPEVSPGELLEIETRTKRARHDEVRAARTLEQLQALGRARGYHPSWATIKYNSRHPHG